MPNPRAFQESITLEIDVIKKRVRNLIGNAHWGEEGRFKEAVLKNVIRRFLPSNLSVGTGFIFKQNGSGGAGEIVMSSQLDIIVYDNTEPLLFSEGDFILTTISSVRGIIEVKSKLNPTTFRDAIRQMDRSVSHFSNNIRIRETNSRRIFFGLFAYEFEGNMESDVLDEALRASRKLVNHISMGPDNFMRFWLASDGLDLVDPIHTANDFYNVYKIQNLSFSYFISNLVDIASRSGGKNYWFRYPIEGTKEGNRERTIKV